MFIPIGDDNSMRRRTPWVVWALVVINAYAWFLTLELGDTFLASYATIPYEITSGIDLRSARLATVSGSVESIPQAPGPHPIYLTLVTSMFLHGSWLHIIGNMTYLLIFGDQIEDRLGHSRFLLFYLLAGVLAGLAQVFAEPTSIIPCVGASGAIAAVLGAYLLLYPRNAVHVLFFRSVIHVPAFVVLAFWGFMQIRGHLGAPGAQGGVAYMAHIGGFVVGAAFGIITRIVSIARR